MIVLVIRVVIWYVQIGENVKVVKQSNVGGVKRMIEDVYFKCKASD